MKLLIHDVIVVDCQTEAATLVTIRGVRDVDYIGVLAEIGPSDPAEIGRVRGCCGASFI
jgi:hypothetical protein